jgi:Sec-independent protein translocase protein TatA
MNYIKTKVQELLEIYRPINELKASTLRSARDKQHQRAIDKQKQAMSDSEKKGKSFMDTHKAGISAYDREIAKHPNLAKSHWRGTDEARRAYSSPTSQVDRQAKIQRLETERNLIDSRIDIQRKRQDMDKMKANRR